MTARAIIPVRTASRWQDGRGGDTDRKLSVSTLTAAPDSYNSGCS